MQFIYSWRWFGPNDRITLPEIRQAGAEAIVTALHQIPVGQIWPKQDIAERKNLIEAQGLQWSVVESLPVSEDIKRQTGRYLEHIDHYKKSIQNLAECGITTLCYNFMPVLDWSRTDLNWVVRDGSQTSGFKYTVFAAFDLFVLQRKDAADDYPEDVIEKAGHYFRSLDQDGIKQLKDTILYGLPGSLQTYTLDEFKRHLSLYDGIDQQQLKEHLRFFLSQVLPVAEKCGVNLAIHPDDPPWNLLGLPRIVSTLDDLLDIVRMVESPANGITLCTGSLGAGHFNDLPGITRALSPHVHFVHLRNVARDAGLNFQEEPFWDGAVDMVAVVKALVEEGVQRERDTGIPWVLPIRPDHGHQMLDDIGKENYPGYSLYGRMRNLAAIEGITKGILGLVEL